MAAINDLYGKAYYYTDGVELASLPVLVVMHGFIDDAADFPETDLWRFATRGVIALKVGMRGRDSSSGSQDACGREIYDIIDGIEYIRANNAYAHPTKAAIVGYSGGGGNALSCACKFPDYFTTIINYFGVSDYGRDGTDDWWTQLGAGDTRTTLETWVGGDPSTVPNNYYARDATVAIQNFTGGKIFIYHDDQDDSIPYVHSVRIKNALDAAGLTNYSYNISTATDTYRWLHGYPNDHVGQLANAEPTWISDVLSREAWTVPASGTVTVIGYLKTKRFEIWLNKNGTATTGIDAVATVAYNTTTDTYTVTPLISGIDVSIIQGAKTGSGSNISAETEIVVT